MRYDYQRQRSGTLRPVLVPYERAGKMEASRSLFARDSSLFKMENHAEKPNET